MQHCPLKKGRTPEVERCRRVGQHSTGALNRTGLCSTHTGPNREPWLLNLGDTALEESVTCVVSDSQPPSAGMPSPEQFTAQVFPR